MTCCGDNFRKPGSMDMTNVNRDQFMGFIDDALDKRLMVLPSS